MRGMKKLIVSLFMICTMLMATSLTVFAITDQNGNDSQATAQKFTMGDTISGSVTKDSDKYDFYKFTLSKSGMITLDIKAYMKNYTMILYDVSGNELWKTEYNEWNEAVGFRQDSYIYGLESGTYYLKVTGYRWGNNDACTGTYTLKTEYISANANESEPNNSIADADSIILGNTVKGLIGLNNEYDFYKFTLSKSGMLTLDMKAYLKNYTMILYDVSGNELWKTEYNEWNEAVGFRQDSYTYGLESGTYYLKVTGYRWGNTDACTGTYTLSTKFVSAEADETEVNNSFAAADTISLGSTVRGLIGLGNEYDFYKFTTSRTGTVTLDMKAYLKNYTMILYDTSGNELWKTEYNEWNEAVGFREDSHAIDLGAGTYYLKVTGYRWGNTNACTGTYTFDVYGAGTSKPTVTPGNGNNPFVDVNSSQFYYDPVIWAVKNNITTGVSATRFAPDATCTRGQIVTFLWRAAGSPQVGNVANPFEDVPRDKYYYSAVLWAINRGITTGMTDRMFAPDATCTRGQIVTFLWRAVGKPEAGTATNSFGDVLSGEYYYTAVLWAVNKGITKGYTYNRFAPNNVVTRGETVTFLYRAYN